MIGIITAVTAERDAVLEKMQDVKVHRIYELEFNEGVLNNTRCVMAMAGVGKVNAARCTQLLIDHFQPSCLINVGSAGALHPGLKIGDVVISTSCVQYDLDLTAFGIKKGAFDEDDDGIFKADPQLAALCEQAMAEVVHGEYKVLMGPIATGDQFNNSAKVKMDLYNEFGAYCNEMEGAAVAQVCALCKVPFVVIRSISDNSDDDTLEMYNNFKTLAAKRCVHFLEILFGVLEEQ
ncbi:MAG TPA: 5'-methylthioadenosine/adenosylhomocysteine nucleosidase [Bacillota bacterium]|nr:5'-methylthioadenosine/adenosylhomocysteine nucleosidase [Bacillota bacterium]HOL10058.1 5'-methylthioadenosine/adenosylhomocysteine nucleosidase [Bacillota bacterium]HPO98530.1 5'-methylthioadenosine/adenosylhomocysteine nucleosidase [Bacillota bacterium]